MTKKFTPKLPTMKLKSTQVLFGCTILCFLSFSSMLMAGTFEYYPNVEFENEVISNDSDSTFVQELVGEKFDQISYEQNDLKVIFHKDRIEFLNSKQKENSYFFLMFNDLELLNPTGEGLMNSESVDISGSTMSGVLNSPTMTRKHFKTVKYQMVSNVNKTIEVSVENGTISLSGNIDELNAEFWNYPRGINIGSNQIELTHFGSSIVVNSGALVADSNEKRFLAKSKGGSKELMSITIK